MSIARFSCGVGLVAALALAASCGPPKKGPLIPVDSAILPWQPPEPADGEGEDEESGEETPGDAAAPGSK